jgi:hypothetical protein
MIVKIVQEDGWLLPDPELRDSAVRAANTVTYPGPPVRPSDTWRLVDAGSPLPRVGRHRTAASVPGTGSPAGAASRVGPGDLDQYSQ